MFVIREKTQHVMAKLETPTVPVADIEKMLKRVRKKCGLRRFEEPRHRNFETELIKKLILNLLNQK